MQYFTGQEELILLLKYSYDNGTLLSTINLKKPELPFGRDDINYLIISQDDSTAYIQIMDTHPIFAFNIGKCRRFTEASSASNHKYIVIFSNE